MLQKRAGPSFFLAPMAMSAAVRHCRRPCTSWGSLRRLAGIPEPQGCCRESLRRRAERRDHHLQGPLRACGRRLKVICFHCWPQARAAARRPPRLDQPLQRACDHGAGRCPPPTGPPIGGSTSCSTTGPRDGRHASDMHRRQALRAGERATLGDALLV